MIPEDPPQVVTLNELQLIAERNRREFCALCGQRLGKHRFGDNACPNVDWKIGNGQPQWREGWRFQLAR